jgi:hypothetical protein
MINLIKIVRMNLKIILIFLRLKIEMLNYYNNKFRDLFFDFFSYVTIIKFNLNKKNYNNNKNALKLKTLTFLTKQKKRIYYAIF